eukprot:Hpha_TRINITY_DN6070_c0_g1::TRINITY_DN6070_c0_g1_i1::g.63376::m.63376
MGNVCKCGRVEPEHDLISQWSGFETPTNRSLAGGFWNGGGAESDDDEYNYDALTMYTPRSDISDDTPEGFPPVPMKWRTCRPTKVCVEDGTTGRVFRPNVRGFLVDNEMFKGRVAVMTRTGREDGFFAGKKRTVEVQIQGRFKQSPQGLIWLGAEVKQNLQLSGMRWLLATVCIKCAQTFNANVAIVTAGAAGTDEQPHMMLPLGLLVDSWIVTPPGETPPRLGTRLPLGDLQHIRKEYRQDYPFDPSLTYTFSWHSMYFDFEDWRIANIPGATGTSLKSFWNEQPLTLTAYALPDRPAHHGKSIRQPIFDATFYHESHPGFNEIEQKVQE